MAGEVAAAASSRLERVLGRVPDGVARVRRALLEGAGGGGAPVDGGPTLESWAARCFPKPTKQQQYVRELFGVDEAPAGGYATDAADLARRHGVKAPNISVAVSKARDEWAEDAELRAPFAMVGEILREQGGACSVSRLADGLLQRVQHASAEAAPRLARGLVRAAAEVACRRHELVQARVASNLWIAVGPDHVGAAKRLVRLADAIAARQPLPAFEPIEGEVLAAVTGTPLEGQPAERLVQLECLLLARVGRQAGPLLG